MGGKGKDESVDPFTGKGYTADEMPEDPTLPAEFSPFLQPPTTQKPELFRAPGAGPLAPPAGSGGTDFEPYRLNQIVDLVEDASPQDLEDVGDALWDAARAIRKAAEELKTYFDGVESEWKGVAKKHFSDWATGLHRDTLKLSEYAGAAGTQLKAAGFGLSMVKASMPKRDPKEDEIFGPYLPPKITKKSTPELREREKNRQEAIQQANKLSSYYTVALTNIKAAEESKPVFATMPNVGVPPPPRTGSFGPGDHGAGGGQGPVSAAPYIAGSSPGTTDHAAAAYVPRGDEGVSTTEPLAPHHRPEGPVQPGVSVATDIDSAPPAPVAPMEPGTPPQLPAPGQPGLPPSGPPSPGPVVVPPGSPPSVGRMVPPTGRPPSPGRVGPGTSGPQRPYMPPPTNTGRTGQTGPTGPGRPGPVRPGPVSPGTSAPTNRDAGRTGPRGLGRPGPMGVPPGTAGPHAGGGRGTDSGSARASQRGGIVGGTPSRSGTGETPASSSRQRGTVIDGQGAAAARRPMGVTPPVNAVGSGGVSGANGRRSGSGRKKATGREGVVGEPRDDESGQPLDARVAMPGGAGLVMGAAQQSSKKERRQEERRPNKSTDEEQQRPTGRRGSVPPVVE
ncbi:hypothetical protein SAMN05421870_113175 [Streptomyces qinglanensis]|uniref:PPE family protein n=1 Tax=Streptomyces qinglanensis TaxID=943816 RepID=A0A1H9VVF8_9ACTN|nr:hypothetical protein SAMN05421870_113175 [Streptomyces qinglanensis]